MTPKERLLTAMVNGIPDRVPACPDFSNYIPCKRTGLPFWDIYFYGKVPLWQAYLNAADHFGTEAWMASCTGVPFTWEPSRVEYRSEDVHRSDMDAMVRRTTIRTPDGDMTSESTCMRSDPPSPTEKPIKDLTRDFRKFKWTMGTPTGIDMPAWNEMRRACEKREQAFGVCVGYPGFQAWSCFVERGVEPLAYAQIDSPEILDEWFELDMAHGTRAVELALAARPDYLLFGGSGTITMASPSLAAKYAIPALKKWSRMARDAGVPTMLHSCGKERILVDMLAEDTDVNCVNPLEPAPMGDVDLAELKQAHGGRLALMGNLHTTDVMLRGSVQDVRRESLKAIRAAGGNGGFILSSGDQCGRDTPDENIREMVRVGEEFGTYPLDLALIDREIERLGG